MLRYDRQTKPGLVTLYDIRPGNRAGPFLQSRSPHRAVEIIDEKLETKASSHEGQCILAGYCHVHMLLYGSVVNYTVNTNYT